MKSAVTSMRARRLAAGALVLALLGCDTAPKGEPVVTPPGSETPPPPGQAEATTEPAGAEGASEALKPPPYTPFGVPECDRFLVKYLACVEGKVPEDQRDKFRDELKDNRTRWWKLAEMKQGLVAVGFSCRIFAQSKKSDLTVDYGCEF